MCPNRLYDILIHIHQLVDWLILMQYSEQCFRQVNHISAVVYSMHRCYARSQLDSVKSGSYCKAI